MVIRTFIKNQWRCEIVGAAFRFTSSAAARYHGAIVAMRFLVCFLLLALGAPAQQLTLERLFRRPFLWGTSPDQVTWSKEGHTLAFLWNASGKRFLDLYAYHPGSSKLVRLTDLEPVKDDLNLTDEEKDERQKNYLEPLAGLGSFELSRDGSHAAFSSVVCPLASAAAIMRFSVPVTVITSNTMTAPRRRLARAVTLPCSRSMRAPIAASPLRC